jgi:hypothetical protein
MKFSYRTLSPLLLICTLTLSGQDTWHGTVSGMQMMYNPAFAGVEGNSVGESLPSPSCRERVSASGLYMHHMTGIIPSRRCRCMAF